MELAYTKDKAQVFCDFVELAAISISNQCDMIHYNEREKRYLQIIEKYPKDKIGLFCSMLSCVMQACSRSVDEPKDFLGEIYHELELHNKWRGQFFTPIDICRFMGEINVIDLENQLMDKDYVTVSDPCVGSGAMLLGFAGAMANHHYDYTAKMRATATDIDLKCVHMAYIQTSLYGIPATIVHGDSLSMNEWSYWFTPTMCKIIAYDNIIKIN